MHCSGSLGDGPCLELELEIFPIYISYLVHQVRPGLVAGGTKRFPSLSSGQITGRHLKFGAGLLVNAVKREVTGEKYQIDLPNLSCDT